MLWPLVSFKSCVSPLDACRYNAADAPYVEARTMPVATKSALNVPFMCATPLEILTRWKIFNSSLPIARRRKQESCLDAESVRRALFFLKKVYQ